MVFKKGQSGNPDGRPQGKRNKLTEAFMNDLHQFWVDNKAAVFKEASSKEPMKFCQMIADLLPKEAKVDVSGTVTHHSEPVSELDGFLRQALAVGEDSQDKKPLPN